MTIIKDLMNLTQQDILREIQKGSIQADSELFKQLIKEHKTKKEDMQKRYAEFLGDVDILDKPLWKTDRANNKIPNDFRGEIVDQCVGYLAGNPIVIKVKENELSESEREKITEIIDQFKEINNSDSKYVATLENAGIMGYAAWLMYKPEDNKVRFMNVDPYECIFINNGSLDVLEYVLRYYEIQVFNTDSGKWETATKVEFYDKDKITYYVENQRTGDYILDPDEITNPAVHGFDRVPLIQVKNNRHLLGDFDKVDNSIDAYDKLVSYLADESEQFRNSSLYVRGQGIMDDETIANAMRVGVWDLDETGEIGFISKNADTTSTQELLNILKNNIYRFSRTVDMSSESFSGANESGESRKWKLINLITKAKTKERNFIHALRQQYDILFSVVNVLTGKKYDSSILEFIFTYNLPVDLAYTADIIQKLQGLVSQQTLLSLLPFIEDPLNEIETMLKEKTNSGTALVRQTLNTQTIQQQRQALLNNNQQQQGDAQ